MLSVLFFRTKSGREPVREWLRGLEREERKTIGEDLLTVQLGFPLGMPLCRPLGKNLYEVRSSLPTRREARLMFFQSGTRLIVVSGFVKKTQKTPDTEIALARARMNEFDRASKENERPGARRS